MIEEKGMLVVVSGPAGVGKGTICRELFIRNPGLDFSVSVTTRAPRPGEKDGTDYFFHSREKFESMIENDELLEWAEFCGNYYGTPLLYVKKMLAEGKTIVLEIDIQGARQVKKLFSDGVFIFVVPPSLDVLSKRLHNRGTESEEVMQQRLTTALEELKNIYDYDYIVENNNLKVAVEKLMSIITAENCRVNRNSVIY